MNEQRPYSPIDPEYGPNAFDMLAGYRQRSAQLRGQVQQSTGPDYNPYAPESNEGEEDQHVSDLEQWLAPVKMDAFTPQTSYTFDKHENFMKNLGDDPAVKEYGDQFHGYLSSLVGAMQSGQIDQDQAQAMGQDYLESVVLPIISKHHSGKDSGSFHKKREPEIPDIVKKVRGGK